MCKRCWIKDFLSSSLLSRLSYDFSLTFIQTLWRWVGGWQNNEGWKRKKGWKMTVRGSDLLHWDGLRAHREDHPLQQSRVAHSKRGRGRGRGERRGRQNRHLLLLVPTAWLEQKSGTGVWILDFSFTERLPEQMERYGENGWETEERHRARDSKRLFFFFHGTEQTLPLSQCHSSLARHLIFFFISLYYCMCTTILQLLPCPYLQCCCGWTDITSRALSKHGEVLQYDVIITTDNDSLILLFSLYVWLSRSCAVSVKYDVWHDANRHPYL